jgi:hyperosmotically inducible protein
MTLKQSRRFIGPLLAAFLFVLGGCAGNGANETTGQYVDDSVITSKVKSAFVEDSQVSALNISVTTNKGVVELSGNAKTSAEANKAAQLARNVNGVKAVRNHIAVSGG